MKNIIILLQISLLALACTRKDPAMFVLLNSKETGVTFNNDITESDSLNILDDEFIYNGGGVGVGDFNGDGLSDLYFTGSQVDNKLYLNRGNMKFEDVTGISGTAKSNGQWSSGVNVLDINRDGLADIYVCNTFINNPQKRKNLLFINQGNNEQGVPVFLEQADQYGIADTTHSSHAQFFDSDNDGDLDLFIGVNVMDTKIPNRYVEKVTDGSAQNTDRLYRNDNGKFTDVSLKSGIRYAGFSHSTLTADFNGDGWQDIYVANDYVSNDLLYLNNRKGGFENQISGIFKHQAASAMGSDLGDINNDGLSDMFTTEMLPYYNKRKKLFLGANNYSTYINNNQYGYEYQFGRNVMQLNRGLDPKTGLPVFSDVAFMTGTQETEWSWAPLLADYDNDGNCDLFVTNGFPRDVTDHDFALYYSTDRYLIAPVDLQERIPQVKSPKFLFKNYGELSFEDISESAGVAIPAFSNGAAYADLDNDGDLDLVVNNIDQEAFIFKNTLNDSEKKPDYLRIKLEGRPENPDAFGAEVTACFNGKKQKTNAVSGRGYLSCSERVFHFGLGNATTLDSVIVNWGGNETSVFKNLNINSLNIIKYSESKKFPAFAIARNALLNELEKGALGLDFTPAEFDYIDFNAQPTLPHKFTQYGPALAVGDVNGDGDDDLLCGGSAQHDAVLFFSSVAEGFDRSTLSLKSESNKQEEDLGLLLFDADSDADLDIYIARGSPQQAPAWPYYQDVLFVNDGSGSFTPAPGAVPKETSCNQSARAADFDGDGDPDIVSCGRVMPKNYPKPDRSFILRNDTQRGGPPVFTDVTREVCPELEYIGMVSDVLWTDFNNDFRPDLVVAGEWMPLVFFENKNGKLVRISKPFGTVEPSGWWTSLSAADFDNDGDTDYIAGNMGTNTYFQCSADEPVRVYAKDFDNNGVYDPFISCYWKDSLGRKHEYFYHTRDDMLKQLISLRKKYNTYGQLGEATVQDIFTPKQLEGAQILQADFMASCLVENLGGGKFRLSPLPPIAQVAPVFGVLPRDVNNDGIVDVILTGNDYGMELIQGRADASYGLVLINSGNSFRALEPGESGFTVSGDARALVSLIFPGRELVVASQNNAPLRVFELPHPRGIAPIRIAQQETTAVALFPDGRKTRFEFYTGNGFLSQSSKTLFWPAGAQRIELYNSQGQKTRTLQESEQIAR